MIPGTKTTVEMDMDDFNSTLRRYQSLSSKTWVQSVNQRAANLALKTIKHTPKSMPATVRSELKSPARVAPRAPLAAVLVNYHRGKKGKSGLTGKPLARTMRRAITYRARSSGYLKSAWFGAIADLKPYVKKLRAPRAKKGFKLKGSARPERRKKPLNPIASIQHGFRFGTSIDVAKRALSKAIRAEKRDMMVYIRRKMGSTWGASKI